MTDDAKARFTARSAHRLTATALIASAALVAATTAWAGSAAGAVSAAAATPTPEPYSCAPNGPAGNQTIYGTFGDAGVIGWTGNTQAVVACLGGSFFVDTSPADGGPGSASTTAVTGTSYGYGVYNDSKTTWANADGYLPALVTTFHADGARISITNFGDRDMIGGHPYVVVYSRVQVTNPTGHALTVDPAATAGLVPLSTGSDTVPAHGTVDHDYAVAANTFGGSYALPAAAALVAAGGYSQHFAHMRAYWNAQLAGITQIQRLPDASLVDAYRTGFIYTQIIRSGNELKTGANGYDKEFSHDVIGILANLFTQGYTSGAHGLLDRARYVIGTQTQYDDGVWTYPWVWAIYLLKTGDLNFVKANFDTNGPAGATEPSIEATAHLIATDRTGPGGIMEETSDIDANGYWTIDNYEALTGLAAYRWLAEQVGNTAQANWAASEYTSLLAATSKTLDATIGTYHLNYLPCSMVEPNTDNRCANAEDANWAAPFLFGRWAWDGYLFGAKLSGPGISLINATYSYGFQPAGRQAAAGHLRRLPDAVLQHCLQRRLRRMGPGQHEVPGSGHPQLRVHDRGRAERPVLVVGEPAVPQPRCSLDRHPPGGRQRRRTARLGHGQRQHGATRFARGAAGGWRSDRRAGRAGHLGADRQGHPAGQLRHYRRTPSGPDRPHQRSGGDPDPDRPGAVRAGALPAAGIRRQHRARERRNRQRIDRHGDDQRQHA